MDETLLSADGGVGERKVEERGGGGYRLTERETKERKMKFREKVIVNLEMKSKGKY